MKLSSSRRLLSIASFMSVASAALAQPAVEWKVSDGGNGHWYQWVLVPEGISWSAAKARAEALGGHLATPTSAAENLWLFELTKPTSTWINRFGPWLGGFQDLNAADYSEPAGGWRWVTGEPWQWTGWWQWEPSNFYCTHPGEDKLHYIDYQPLWNDITDEARECEGPVWSFLVEWESDCDGDGVVDYGQILNGLGVDTNDNGVLDACEGGLVSQAFDPHSGWPTTQPPNDVLVRHLTTGSGVVAGLDASNRVVAWGTAGGIMAGMPTDPVRALSIGGADCAVAVHLDGTLHVWGMGTQPNSLMTFEVPQGNDFVSVSAARGARHASAMRTDGSIATWGSNQAGECDMPAGVYRAVSAGGHLFWSPCTLGLRTSGEVVQAGGGGWFGGTPVESNFHEISCGYYHGLALRNDGTVVAWGFNRDGQCNVPGGVFASVSAGSVVSVALRPSGELVAWGDPSYIQLSVPLGAKASEIAADCYGTAVLLTGDCDHNGVLDCAEVVAGVTIDRDRNGLGDSCECDSGPGSKICCRDDLDFDGEVSASDLSVMLISLGNTGGSGRDFDLDGSGLVDTGDVALLLLDFGPCPSAD